ncbi:unnamed protein product [Spirodela intermedia]|uniref:RanBP2-type domain-containing protein n=1 Tax=Spirodela intermedia TaxID=51605 RepID=A0A7I8I9Y0_SPIIN|nr:unnamed protein product [Spirodela intermedia]CAA6654517.1 unnamed protein product [Spirodela intermedia]
MPEDFRNVAGACLYYAREWPDILRSLSKKDIEVVVENGLPFLFKNASASALPSEQACTVDLMRYLLSYAWNLLNLVGGIMLDLVTISSGSRGSNATKSSARHSHFGYEESQKHLQQTIEMKKGDWFCPKCKFMNFARNLKCLECNEARPKKQLTGGEWECPQCDFFNYGRNLTCLRCDCKRPEEIPSSRRPGIEQILNSGNINKTDIERRLAENDEKAERWFSKVSQLDDSSDLSSAIADEDFPEIMPLRKGTNRFVVSTRKTPLERRLANTQYRHLRGNEVSYMGNDSLGRAGSDKMSESAISQTLDRILGSSPATSGTHSLPASGTSRDTWNDSISGESNNIRSGFTSPDRKSSGFVPSVSVSSDMSCKEQNAAVWQVSNKVQNNDTLVDAVPGRTGNSFRSDFFSDQKADEAMKRPSHPSELGSKKPAQSPGITNTDNEMPNKGFLETMPMHGKENGGDHSLVSPHYKRRIAIDQANNSNFIPFVPFPPDYFAKKGNQNGSGISTEKHEAQNSSSAAAGNDKRMPPKFEENSLGYSNEERVGYTRQSQSTRSSGSGWNSGPVQANLNERRAMQQCDNLFDDKVGSSRDAFHQGNPGGGVSGSSNWNRPVERLQKVTENGNHGFAGKSLEGSAVTEPDPLDMSEEAKAQRWFRRVSQIKDISELSNIPDEDFPEIMPMRKGVNRFVVSKRKTPLERRLTSPQYRRNLPIVSSNPNKDSTKE